tara:strand:- start:116 stop:547 length:432 start_codon:yes stop_codon:yes gene_type:complete
MKLTSKEESFAQAFIATNRDLIQAYRKSEYSQKLTADQMSVQANKLFNKPKINLRIAELTKKVIDIAEKKFTITIEQRLRWLNEIVDAGLEIVVDASGVAKRQNLPASKSAIDTLNNMLGTDEASGTVKPVKVLIGVKDASRS